jgi:hypothetical protein
VCGDTLTSVRLRGTGVLVPVLAPAGPSASCRGQHSVVLVACQDLGALSVVGWGMR